MYCQSFEQQDLHILGRLKVLLILVLFLGVDVNNARCWFRIPFLGSLQPSEFMKIFLIMTLTRMISDFNEEHSNPSIEEEFKFLMKVLI